MLRITVAGGLQQFVFACPHCRSEIHGTFYAQVAEPFELRSEDFELLDTEQEQPETLCVPVTTDMPVHTSLVGVRADAVAVTPFIQLASTVGSGVLSEVMPRIERLRALRSEVFPHLRRGASQFTQGDLSGVADALGRAPGGADIDFEVEDPVDVLGVAFAGMYAPFEDTGLREEAAKEWAKTFGAARVADEPALRSLYVEVEAGPLVEHRARVIDTAVNVLATADALYPAVMAERMEGQVELSEYRVMRDDFDVLKVRYQDIFELGSRTLAFTGRVANIAYRNDARTYADGERRTLHKALNKTTSYKREPWLADFPVAKRLFDAMNRHTRNDIGHRLVRYDFNAGSLVYDDGATENYLLFLVDYLHAVRLTHYLVDVVEILWHVREPLMKGE